VRDPDDKLVRCRQCLDEGWIVIDCPAEFCGRHHEHGPHEFAVRCPCWLRSNASAINLAVQDALQKGKPMPSCGEALRDLEVGIYRFATAKTERARWAEARERQKGQAA
jgi:hypothetical protein